MSAAQPPRHKGQAGGFEQRMAKGPDGGRGFKGAGRGSGGSGGPSPNMVGLKPNGVAHVSPQISFAQMAGKNSPHQQFSDAHAGMMPPAMSLPSTDPRAAARAAAAAAAGAKQKQLEVAAVVSSSANASARAQAAEQAKLQQKRLEAAAEAEAAQLAKQRAQQAAIQEDQKRRQQLLEAAKQDAMNRQIQLERAARAQEAGSGQANHSVPSSAHAQQSMGAQSISSQPPGDPQQQVAYVQQQGQHANSAVGVPQTAARPAARPIDGHAWPAIKPKPSGVPAPAPQQNVWGAVPSSILKAPAPKEEKKPAVEQQKMTKTENAPQQKNAWGKVTLGRAAEVKPGSVKPPGAPSQSSQNAPQGTDVNAKSSEESHPEPDLKERALEPDWQGSKDGEAEKERARKMVDDFLRQRGMQGEGEDEIEDDPWASENVHRITEDSNDTEEVFFMRPNGVTMQAASQDGNKDPWDSEQQPAPVKPSAWALGAPRITSREDEAFADAFAQGAFGQGGFGQGFGQVDCPEGLMNFDLSCDDVDMFSSGAAPVPTTSAWGNPNLKVHTKEDSDKEEDEANKSPSEEEEDEANKSPSVALKMLLGIGMGGSALPDAPVAAPPAARKLPVWAKPDGKVDISLDPAIAQIATDMPPADRSAMLVKPQNAAHTQGNGHGNTSESAPSVESAWESKLPDAPEPPKNHHVPPPEPTAREPQSSMAPPQHIMQQLNSGLPDMQHQPSHLNRMPPPSSMMQNMSQLQGPSAFMNLGPSKEPMGDMGGNRSMPPMPPMQMPQQVQPEDGMQPIQGNNMPGPGQGMPSERAPDSLFSFGMGGPNPGSRTGDNPNLPPWMQHQQGHPMMGMGGMGMMPNPGSHLGDNPNLPPWMQQMQGSHMGGMGGMGMMPNAGPRPGDTHNLPPWMMQPQQQHHQQQQQGPIGIGPPGGMGNGPPPGMGMGMMNGMGPGGGMDLLQMLGGPGRQGLMGSNVPPPMGSGTGVHAGGQPEGSSGFNFAAFANQNGAGQPPQDDGGGGGFDFNRVFGGMGGGGQANMPQMPPMPPMAGPRPGSMMSLAELEGRMGS